MTKKAYIGGANGEARKLKNIYVRPDSGVVHRKVKKVYIGVNGVAEQCYQSDMTATSASVSALNYTFNQSVTIVDVCYGGGYWFAVGYNSSRIYIAFATSLTGMWNSWYWNVDSAIPTAIAYADGYVWITVDEESNTKNYNLLRFAVNDIVSDVLRVLGLGERRGTVVCGEEARIGKDRGILSLNLDDLLRLFDYLRTLSELFCQEFLV